MASLVVASYEVCYLRFEDAEILALASASVLIKILSWVVVQAVVAFVLLYATAVMQVLQLELLVLVDDDLKSLKLPEHLCKKMPALVSYFVMAF